MGFYTKIITTWPSEEVRFWPSNQQARVDYINELTQQGFTDGFTHLVGENPTQIKRLFIDAESAQMWGDFLVAQSQSANIAEPTFVVLPAPYPDINNPT